MNILNTDSQKNNLYLLDEQFLNEMTEQKQRDIYARIISLDINENPIEQIEGKITTGSINIDGSSAVRRTCSLTMVSQEVNITDYYWGVKTKFKLEIGLKNKINKKYPDIIWYPQGIYVITTFNTSLSANNCTISIQGKDKMCLLNGDISGQMYASVNFGIEEVIKTEMNAVDFSYAINSAQIISQGIQKYYICDFRSDDNNGITTPPTPILKNNSYPYIFVKENKNNDSGVFYYKFDKQNNWYEQNSDGEYKIYKIIENPDEIFINVSLNKSQYKSNFYYNQSTELTKYYTIETRNANQIYQDNVETKSFYQLKDIYNKSDNYTKEKNPIDKIIREAVHTYGKEPYHNIIINDLDNYGLEQLTYKGDITLYALKDFSSGEFTQLVRKGSISSLDTIVKDSKFQFEPKNNEINNNVQPTVIIYQNSKFIKLPSPPSGNSIPSHRYYTVAQFEYGDDIGYRLTDLVYTGDLVSNVGDSLTSVLDKIKTMLGDFEYFYDLEGRFVFQRKKTYINVSWNTMVDNKDEKYFTFANDESKFSFNFEGNRLISAIQNSPKITNLRNDFSVWGKRKNTSGADVNVHMRYAIDKKPVYYKALNGKIYYNIQEKQPFIETSSTEFDSLPLLNSTSIDQFLINNKKTNFYLWNFKNFIDYFNIEISSTNPVKSLFSNNFLGFTKQDLQNYFNVENINININEDSNLIKFISITKEINNNEEDYTIAASTGEQSIAYYYRNYKTNDNKQYYIFVPSTIKFNNITERFVDWREIIYQMALDYFAGQGCSNDNSVFLSDSNYSLTDPDQFLYEVGKRNPEYYPTGYTGYEQYYTDMQGFWRLLYNPEYVPKIEYEDGYYNDKNWEDLKKKKTIYEYYSTADSDKMYWNKTVFEAPETLDFWIDFLDSNLELYKFSVPQIGDRSKTVKDDKAGAIIYREIPNLILYDSDNNNTPQREAIIKNSGYRFINLPKGFSQFFTISYRSKSVKDKIDDLLYEHTYAQDNITITSIPIYHLEPNTIIYVKDDNTGINGEYIATRFTIPLNYNGTMSITANKAPQRLI